jgi:3-hydroxyacyl-CoA dehydrogenase/3-hydroxy-2-methylbutyryl-CoA dehydrogenase
MKPAGAGALVTGGASGLGEAVVRLLAAAGARVTIADLPVSAGAELAAQLGPDVAFLATDIAVEEQVAGAVGEAVAFAGRLDLCVNCAGINPGGRVLGRDGEARPLDAFRRAVDVNLVGLFDVARQAAAAMAANEPGEDGERGLIVNVASIVAFEGQPGQTAYTASKGGVAALTIQLAREFADHGIRVMAIAPGMMDTPMFAAIADPHRQALVDTHVFPRRPGHADEFAGLVRTFMETPLLNGEIVRLDAAARLGPK